MKKIKIILLAIFSSFTFLFAQDYDVGFSADVRLIAENLGEDEGKKVVKSPDVDDLTLKFQASVDNVSAFVEFDDNGDEALAFDKAQMTVADLFNGLLTVTLFDIGFAKGNNEGLLPDTSFNGVKLAFQPIDIVSFYVGYGYKNTTFGGVLKGARAEAAAGGTDADAFYNIVDNGVGALPIFNDSGISRDGDNLKAEIHAISLGSTIDFGVVDAELHAGMMLFDNAPYYIKDGATIAQLADGTGYEETTLALLNIGVGVNPLKFLGGNFLKIEFGVATGALTIDAFRSYASAREDQTANQELVFQATAYGDTGDIFDVGFGIGYRLVFASDNPVKEQALGDLKDLDDDTYADLFEVTVTPYYTISQFTFKLPIEMSIVGENVVYDLYRSSTLEINKGVNADGEATGITNIEVEPTVVWNAADGISAEFYGKFGLNDIAGDLEPNNATSSDYDDFAQDIEVGMRLKVNFNIPGELN